MLRFSGPAFEGVDNRLMSLHLVEFALTNAVMFGQKCDVLQPSEVLYKKAILVERGSFRPVTHVNVEEDQLRDRAIVQEPLVQGKDVNILMEIAGAQPPRPGRNRRGGLSVANGPFIGYGVHGSSFLTTSEYYRLTSYLRRYTKEMIGVALGINNLQ